MRDKINPEHEPTRRSKGNGVQDSPPLITPLPCKIMKKYLAELIGTFALVLVGASAVSLLNLNGPSLVGLVGVALAHGLTVTTMVYALGHVSGIHINPAVTVAMTITGKITAKDAAGYIVAQLIGAALAGFMLKALFTSGNLSGYLGSTLLNDNLRITPGLGLLCETVGTFLFFIVIFGAAVDGRTAGNLAGLAIGLSLAVNILCFGPLTGASFNPARSFGPALASNYWPGYFWIYWVGPIVGGSLAGLLQTRLFMKS